MMRLFPLLFSMIATVLMGIGIVAVLTMNMFTLKPILIAAAVGFVLAIPATMWVSVSIQKLR